MTNWVTSLQSKRASSNPDILDREALVNRDSVPLIFRNFCFGPKRTSSHNDHDGDNGDDDDDDDDDDDEDEDEDDDDDDNDEYDCDCGDGNDNDNDNDNDNGGDGDADVDDNFFGSADIAYNYNYLIRRRIRGVGRLMQG